MSQFDDELRRTSAPPAVVPLPPDLSDDALDAPPPPPRWLAIGAVMAAATLIVVAGGIGIGALLPGPSPSPSMLPSAEPEPGESALEQPSPSPSASAAAEASPSPSESAVAQPSPPPAEPITASVEEERLRLTVTLDRSRTVYGQRVLATATIENTGADSVYWGHSGTCVHPVGVAARPDDSVPLRLGRGDWPGDEGILKLVTIDPHLPEYGFLPEEWLDQEGNFGCTTDLVVSEIPAGEARVQRRGWDTVGQHGMPPPPGSYTVLARFGYMSRGEQPAADAAVDEFSVEVAVPLVVEGPEIDYVSPGEAVDALLSDYGFRSLLAEAPRELWVQSSLTFVDRRWELVLYLSASDVEVEPVDAVVGIVDARSGEVLETLREPRTRPGGG